MNINVNKAAVAGFVFFMSTMAGVLLAAPMIGMGGTTIALLGAALIGIFVTVPTVALIMIIGLRPHNDGQVKVPPEPRQLTPPAHHTHYHTHNTVNVYTSRAPHTMTPFQICSEVATALRVSRHEAERMIEAGEVKLLPPGGKR
jgi:predicted lipid-binding transport protein (Tim44 family)